HQGMGIGASGVHGKVPVDALFEHPGQGQQLGHGGGQAHLARVARLVRLRDRDGQMTEAAEGVRPEPGMPRLLGEVLGQEHGQLPSGGAASQATEQQGPRQLRRPVVAQNPHFLGLDAVAHWFTLGGSGGAPPPDPPTALIPRGAATRTAGWLTGSPWGERRRSASQKSAGWLSVTRAPRRYGANPSGAPAGSPRASSRLAGRRAARSGSRSAPLSAWPRRPPPPPGGGSAAPRPRSSRGSRAPAPVDAAAANRTRCSGAPRHA